MTALRPLALSLFLWGPHSKDGSAMTLRSSPFTCDMSAFGTAEHREEDR